MFSSLLPYMVPIGRAFTLEATAQLDDDVLQAIHDAGYSRVPVVVKKEVDRYILVKDILTLFSFSRLPERVALGKLRMHAPLWIAPDHSLFELLNEFQTGFSHMAFVSLSPETKKAAIGM
jgi:CBS domain containing-hemolysin-like protein